MNMPLLTYIKEISPRPVLIIAGEKAHSRYFSEDAYKAVEEPKELVIIPNAVDVDLYDKFDVIPFDKLNSFFEENLKSGSTTSAQQIDKSNIEEAGLKGSACFLVHHKAKTFKWKQHKQQQKEQHELLRKM
jgi:hypothetical protein